MGHIVDLQLSSPTQVGSVSSLIDFKVPADVDWLIKAAQL